jgi:hypothetical protein
MKATKFLYLFIGLILFQSCEDVVDLDLDDTEILLVVEGEVNDEDSIQWVRLSRTTDYFENQPPDYSFWSEATVNLYQNDNLFGTMDYNSSTSRFEIPLTAQTGEEYYIRIDLPNGKSYQSEVERINRVNPIDTIWYEVNDEPTFGDETEWEIYIESQEEPGKGDYYQWKVYLNGEYQAEPNDLSFAEDELVDGNYIEEFDVYTFDEEEYDELIAPTGYIDVVVYQTSISRLNYEFLSDLASQTAFAGGPFSPPPAALRGNLRSLSNEDERVLGFFAGVSKRSASIRIEP